jgi:acyl-CoA thioesterase I
LKLILILFTLLSPLGANASKILFLGDSLTEGYGVQKSDSYPSQLQLLLNKKGLKVVVINAGSSGSTTASGPSRLRWHLKSAPKILVLALGGNDGLRGVKLESTKINLEKTITMAKGKGIRVILGGMKLPHNYGSEYRKKFENLFQTLASKHKVLFIPFMLKDVGGINSLNLPDGIHPNEKGHKIIARNILPIIIKALEVSQ